MSQVKLFNGAYGSEIKNNEELIQNLKDNAIPELVIEGTYNNYLGFLLERSLQMALKIKAYYEKL